MNACCLGLPSLFIYAVVLAATRPEYRLRVAIGLPAAGFSALAALALSTRLPYTTVRPDPAELVGKWRTDLGVATLELSGNGEFALTNFSDWTVSIPGNGTGKWELAERSGYWELRLTYRTKDASTGWGDGRLDILQNVPPYELMYEAGDPDAPMVVRFRKKT